MKILVIAPLHDYPTILSNRAVSQLLDFMNELGIKYNLLRFISVNRPTINLLASLNHYDGIFYYGHGDTDRLGDWVMPLIGLIDKRNIKLFKNSIIYTMACLSGIQLSKTAIKNGVRAYFGHNVRYFAFVKKLGLKYDFLQDWIDLVNYIPQRLLLGDDTGIAMMKYEQFANKLYAKYLALDRDVNLQLLYQNALHLTLYGDRTAKLY